MRSPDMEKSSQILRTCTAALTTSLMFASEPFGQPKGSHLPVWEFSRWSESVANISAQPGRDFESLHEVHRSVHCIQNLIFTNTLFLGNPGNNISQVNLFSSVIRHSNSSF